MNKMKKLGLRIAALAMAVTLTAATSLTAFAAGTKLNLYSDFPVSQGDNGFHVVWGPSFDKMKEDSCVRSTDIPDNQPQQWKGGSEYATLTQSWMMPGDGCIGVRWEAPADGKYSINFKWEFSQAAKSQITDPKEQNFDGFEIGIANADNKKIYKQIGNMDLFREKKSLTVELKKGETITMYMDKLGNGGYDQADYELVITDAAEDAVVDGPQVDKGESAPTGGMAAGTIAAYVATALFFGSALTFFYAEKRRREAR